jgi:hypothetical protein
MRATTTMTGATAAAIRFGRRRAICFGTSSPCDQRNICDGDNDDSVCQRIGKIGADADLFQEAGKALRQRRAAEYAGQDTDESDSDLDARQKPAGIVEQRQRGHGAAVSFRHKTLQPRPAGGNDRQLGHGEKAVDRYEDQNDQYLDV